MTWLPEINHLEHPCTERVQIALQQDPDLRGQIGVLLERALTDDGREIWAAICAHHCWLNNKRGHVVETSCGTFTTPQPGLTLLGEPRQRRWIQLKPEQQDRVLKLAALNQLKTTAELIYCPGRIAGDQVPSPRYATTWGTLAKRCSADGGWDQQHWSAMCDELPSMLGLV